jgi:hypothetical protein
MMTSHVVRWARSVPRALGVTALLGALAAGPAAAQTPSRPGLWLDAGVGYGRLRLTCATCSSIVALNGPAYTVTVGAALSQNVLLGVQGQSWSGSGGALQQVRSAVAIVQWYPWSAARFFVRTGVGIVQGTVSLTADTTGAHTAKGTGANITLAVGYDFALTRHVGVAVQAATHVAALGDLAVGGTIANDVIAYVSRIGVAVIWR